MAFAGLPAAGLVMAAAPAGKAPAPVAPVAPIPDEFKISLWQQMYSVRGGMGYKDNPTLSSTAPKGSAFWFAGGDAMLFRLPSGGWTVTALGSVDNLSYLDKTIGVENEQSAVAMVQAAKELGNGWKTGLGSTYMYQDQVLDVSASEGSELAVAEVLGHTLTGRWFLRKDLKPYWLEAEATAARMWMSAPIDSSWTAGPRLTLGRAFGPRTQISATWQWIQTAYDTRGKTDSAGVEIPDTTLRFGAHSVGVAWSQTWDDKARWRTSTGIGVDLNTDNSSGYFDSRQYRFAEGLVFSAGTWKVSVNIGLSYLDCPVQAVSLDDPALRRKTAISGGGHVEKGFGKHVAVFANYTYERSLSNAAYDHYIANAVSSGVEFRF